MQLTTFRTRKRNQTDEPVMTMEFNLNERKPRPWSSQNSDIAA